MKYQFRVYDLVVLGLAIILVILLTSCAPLQSLFQNPRYVYEDGAVLVGGDNQPIKLINNAEAVDVSYAELLQFIREDETDQYPYLARGNDSGDTPYVCSDFTETVHNNAETHGIRSGYVGIDFQDGGIGHAVNVFETTDLGIVYIDCTGSSIFSQLEDEGKILVSSWDKVGYIEIGKKYGVIGVNYARLPDYSFFEEYDQKWQEYKNKLTAYNAEVKRYNQEITGTVYREGSAEIKRIRTWEAQLSDKEKALDSLSVEIGSSRFKPLGIVKSTTIHW